MPHLHEQLGCRRGINRYKDSVYFADFPLGKIKNAPFLTFLIQVCDFCVISKVASGSTRRFSTFFMHRPYPSQMYRTGIKRKMHCRSKPPVHPLIILNLNFVLPTFSKNSSARLHWVLQKVVLETQSQLLDDWYVANDYCYCNDCSCDNCHSFHKTISFLFN